MVADPERNPLRTGMIHPYTGSAEPPRQRAAPPGIMKSNVSNPHSPPHRIRTNAYEMRFSRPRHRHPFRATGPEISGRTVVPVRGIRSRPGRIDHCPGQHDPHRPGRPRSGLPTRDRSSPVRHIAATADQTAGTRSAQKGAYSMAPLRKISLGVTAVGESPAATIACSLNARAA